MSLLGYNEGASLREITRFDLMALALFRLKKYLLTTLMT